MLVVVDIISIVPPWVLLGVALGVGASVLVALAFYLGNRVFGPGPTESKRGWKTTSSDRRRREIREYLTATGERFHEKHEFGGVTVPFYLPDREVAITFDAHDYFRLEGEGIYTVLCEHEMPGRGLGRRLPFDVDEPDWGRDRSDRRGRDSVDAAFDELELSREADASEVKRAYRERVKETHPDQGGDEEAFRRVREAYATARNHAEGSGDRTRKAGQPAQTDHTDRSTPSAGFGR